MTTRWTWTKMVTMALAVIVRVVMATNQDTQDTGELERVGRYKREESEDEETDGKGLILGWPIGAVVIISIYLFIFLASMAAMLIVYCCSKTREKDITTQDLFCGPNDKWEWNDTRRTEIKGYLSSTERQKLPKDPPPSSKSSTIRHDRTASNDEHGNTVTLLDVV